MAGNSLLTQAHCMVEGDVVSVFSLQSFLSLRLFGSQRNIKHLFTSLAAVD